MCYHKYYIFTTCGHSFFAPTPLLHCPDYNRHVHTRRRPSITSSLTTSVDVAAPPSAYDTPSYEPPPCRPRAHPFHTVRLHDAACLHCAENRVTRLQSAERRCEVVRFEERKWRVAYASARGVDVKALWSPKGESGGRGGEVEMEMMKRRSVGRTGYSGSGRGGGMVKEGVGEMGVPLPPRVPEKDGG